jgi:hypothetical protein
MKLASTTTLNTERLHSSIKWQFISYRPVPTLTTHRPIHGYIATSCDIKYRKYRKNETNFKLFFLLYMPQASTKISNYIAWTRKKLQCWEYTSTDDHNTCTCLDPFIRTQQKTSKYSIHYCQAISEQGRYVTEDI